MRENLTIKELTEILNNYDENLVIVISRDGKGQEYTIHEDDFKIMKDPYFPYTTNFEKKQQFLRIGIV